MKNKKVIMTFSSLMIIIFHLWIILSLILHIIKRGNWYQDEQDYLKDKYINRKNTKSNL